MSEISLHRHINRILSGLIFLQIISHVCTAEAGTITSRLKSRIQGSGAGGSVAVIVSFSHKIDPFLLRRSTSTSGGLIRALKDSIGARYARIRSIVPHSTAGGRPGLFWINQTIGMSATREQIERLGRDPAIDMVELDEGDFTTDQAPYSGLSPSDVLTIPWNLAITGVDSVWAAYQLDGSGIVIGSLDTGIDTTHPALAGKLRAANAWKDFMFGETAPYDNLGHGTFGSGIIVGGEGTESSGPGIAYRARLVVGKMIDAGSSAISVVTSSMQWMLDPDGIPGTDDFPRIVNNSWYSGTRGSTYAYDAAATWRAAGIIPVFCAGNSGPSVGTTRSPGDYKNCISVGGTDSNDDRYSATSVGPSPADTNFFPTDGRKPDFSAPGAGVYSSIKGGGYSYGSGTSWSAPHVSGIIALMLQANPTLGYDEVFSILKRTSYDAGDQGYDYVFGYGRVSAMGAVREALRARIDVRADPVLHTSESGDSATFEIVLKVWPRDTVWIDITTSDTTECTVTPGRLAFTFGDWEVPRRVVVTGRDDMLLDAEVGYMITMSTESNDPLYDGITPDAINAVNSDDEVVTGIAVTLRAGWNVVSVPTVLNNNDRSVVFPTAISQAYLYESGYYAENPLRRGVGYWMKFDTDQFVDFQGDTTAVETVSVRSGWNLVGSLTAPVAPEGIVSVPPGMTTSPFYGYNGTYFATDSVRPGHAYWVKVPVDGLLILRSGMTGPVAGRVRIAGGNDRPAPPDR